MRRLKQRFAALIDEASQPPSLAARALRCVSFWQQARKPLQRLVCLPLRHEPADHEQIFTFPVGSGKSLLVLVSAGHPALHGGEVADREPQPDLRGLDCAEE